MDRGVLAWACEIAGTVNKEGLAAGLPIKGEERVGDRNEVKTDELVRLTAGSLNSA
jgi:hypothetical protein